VAAQLVVSQVALSSTGLLSLVSEINKFQKLNVVEALSSILKLCGNFGVIKIRSVQGVI
jgi:hypothetical protein